MNTPSFQDYTQASSRKEALRHDGRFFYTQLPRPLRPVYAHGLQEHVHRLLVQLQPGIVCFFLPEMDAPDITPLANKLIQKGYSLCLPRHPHNSPGFPLTFNLWHPKERLGEDALGHPCALGPEVRPDVILTPAFAFDTKGYIIGQGDGSLDATVKRMDLMTTLIALAPDELQCEDLPHEYHDVSMDYIVTPTRIHAPRGY